MKTIIHGMGLIRKTRRRIVSLLLGTIGCWVFVGLCLLFKNTNYILGHILPLIFGALFIAGSVTSLVLVAYCKMLRCPRCNNIYIYDRVRFKFNFGKSCAHCGIPVTTNWESGDVNIALIKDWIAKKQLDLPVPDIGLKCPSCKYQLAGLTNSKCPECGNSFDVSKLVQGVIDL